LDTRNQIIDAAESIMVKKGLQDSTVSEIAQKAGVTDSVIYHYFKSKEDLLFSIIGGYIKRMLDELDEQLEGILEPISRLSKLIWFNLRYCETHRDYSRLLLFECRSNRNFYQHETYKLMQKQADITLSILETGIRVGVFRDDVNMCIVRDLILGVLDQEIISLLTTQETEHCTPDMQKIMELICAMVEFIPDGSKKVFDKPERIFQAAEKVFSEKGYVHSTISEIASIATVAEGTVYEYFENKEDLLLSIPKSRFEEHIDALKEVFEIKTPLRKIRRFIRHHFFLYMTNPEFLKIFLLNIQLNPRFYMSESYLIYKEYTKIIDATLDEGKQAGSVRSTVDNRIFKNIFFGGFSCITLRWLFLSDKESPYDRSTEIDEVVTLFMRAVSNE